MLYVFLRKNYPGYDAKLNVLRVEDLIEDMYEVYSGDPAYAFCSVDVVSMFDNIRMEHVIDIISILNPAIPEGVVDIDELINLVYLDCQYFNYMRFKSPDLDSKDRIRYYRQLGGIPMGGNTSTSFSDLFMGFYLGMCKAKLKTIGVKFTRKYVDDILIYVPISNMNLLIEILQGTTGLDFTLEKSVNGVLSYLDIMIYDIDGVLTTSW